VSDLCSVIWKLCVIFCFCLFLQVHREALLHKAPHEGEEGSLCCVQCSSIWNSDQTHSHYLLVSWLQSEVMPPWHVLSKIPFWANWASWFWAKAAEGHPQLICKSRRPFSAMSFLSWILSACSNEETRHSIKLSSTKLYAKVSVQEECL